MGLALKTPILTPNGFKTLKDIKLKDKIYNENSQLINILEKKILGKIFAYKVTFNDGTDIKVTNNHCWKYKLNRHSDIWLFGTTDELMDIYNHRSGDTRIIVPINKPIPFNNYDKPLYIQPYILGALLGGIYQQGDDADTLSFRHMDPEAKEILTLMLRSISKIYISNTEKVVNFKFINFFEEDVSEQYYKSIRHSILGNHRIPKEYMYNSIDIRLEILRGLVAINGAITKHDHIQCPFYHKKACQTVRDLCGSLGYRVELSKKDIRWSAIIHTRDPQIFTLQKHVKKNQRMQYYRTKIRDYYLRIIKIEPLIRPIEMGELIVNNNDKIVCKDYLVM